MKNLRGISFLIATLFATCHVFSQDLNDRGINRKIQYSIAKIDRSKDEDERQVNSEKLVHLLLSYHPSRVSDSNIHKIADLLEYQNDGVRMFAAMALGRFGDRAKFSAPELLSILKQSDCLQGELTSAAAIRFTLNKFHIDVPPKNCVSVETPKQ